MFNAADEMRKQFLMYVVIAVGLLWYGMPLMPWILPSILFVVGLPMYLTLKAANALERRDIADDLQRRGKQTRNDRS